jgi:hypothetical protein
MEEERLARLAQRKRHTSDDLTSRQHEASSNKKPRLLGDSAALPTLSNNLTSRPSTSQASASSTQEPSPEPQFPNGVVRMTHTRGLQNHEQAKDIRIEDVFLKDHLQMAVLSSFMWDLDWILTKINRSKTNIVIITAVKSDHERLEHEATATSLGMRCVFPPMNPQGGFMHSKLMLLVFEKFLRIVVTSANLVSYDWGETGVMENVVWLIDLPRLPENATAQTSQDLTFFGKELLFFLESGNMPDYVLRGIFKFDFSATEPFAFIHSVSGPHMGSALQRTGFNCLARAIRTLNLRPPGTGRHVNKLHYATASLGNLNDSLLGSLLSATRGISTVVHSRSSGSSKNDAEVLNRLEKARKDRDDMLVYFPTHRTVFESKGGVEAGGTISMRKEWYGKSTFPQGVLRDYISVKKGILSHAKIMLCHSKEGDTAWAFIGSHNMSESAWGKIVKDRAAGQMKLVVRNWECGVLIPVPKEEENKKINTKISNGNKAQKDNSLSEASDEKEANSTDSARSIPLHEHGLRLHKLFAPIIDIPFIVPGATYSRNDTPWFCYETSGLPQSD